MSENYNWRREIKIAAGWMAALVVVVVGFLVSVGGPGSIGPWFLNTVPYGPSDAQRLNFQFAASRVLVVFPVRLRRDSIGLVVVDRETGVSRLVAEYGTLLHRPRFSSDGERLLIVRQEAEKDISELLTCQVVDWKCRVLWRTANSILSPIEIEKDTVLLSSSPLTVRSDGQKRYANNDFYLIRAGSEPNKLSNFRFYRLHALDVMGDKIVFSGRSGETPSYVIRGHWTLSGARFSR